MRTNVTLKPRENQTTLNDQPSGPEESVMKVQVSEGKEIIFILTWFQNAEI